MWEDESRRRAAEAVSVGTLDDSAVQSTQTAVTDEAVPTSNSSSQHDVSGNASNSQKVEPHPAPESGSPAVNASKETSSVPTTTEQEGGLTQESIPSVVSKDALSSPGSAAQPVMESASEHVPSPSQKSPVLQSLSHSSSLSANASSASHVSATLDTTQLTSAVSTTSIPASSTIPSPANVSSSHTSHTSRDLSNSSSQSHTPHSSRSASVSASSPIHTAHSLAVIPSNTGGESIYRTIMNRLTALEANSTLYARYVEEQIAGVREIMRRLGEDVGRLESIVSVLCQCDADGLDFLRVMICREKRRRRCISAPS